MLIDCNKTSDKKSNNVSGSQGMGETWKESIYTGEKSKSISVPLLRERAFFFSCSKTPVTN